MEGDFARKDVLGAYPETHIHPIVRNTVDRQVGCQLSRETIRPASAFCPQDNSWDEKKTGAATARLVILHGPMTAVHFYTDFSTTTVVIGSSVTIFTLQDHTRSGE